MAAQHHTALSLPNFPQVFTQLMDREVTRVSQLVTQAHLGCCDYETPESHWGACDGIPCIEKATVHHLASEREFCLDHFRKVTR